MNYISHHGIKGQKWGIRRFQNEDGTLTEAGKKRYLSVTKLESRNGDTIYLNQRKSKFSDEYWYAGYVNGKRTVDLLLEDQGDSLYVNWIGVKNSERGKGYANAVMDYAIKFASEKGYSYMTLEVPGDSPDARHIYEKKGFVADEQQSDKYDPDDVWSGLTSMTKKMK